MPPLEVSLRAPKTDDAVPGDFMVKATFANAGPEPTTLNLSQASHPGLALELLDSGDKIVHLPPPSAPDERDLEKGETIAQGQSVDVQYAGFLDRSLEPGAYRIRYNAAYEALGGKQDEPLQSDWLEFTVGKTAEVAPSAEPLEPIQPSKPSLVSRSPFWIGGLVRFLCWLWCLILKILHIRRCNRVLTREVDEQRNETISNAPAGAEAWNGNYAWRARFTVVVDEARCRVTVTVRVRLNGAITNAQRGAWETAIESAWNNRFKLCCDWCCCPQGYTIVTDIQFVNSGEHQVVNVGATTTNMGNWGATDTVDVGHEFGHMLGALDEYYTVNGVNYGAGRQATGNIMNNPANNPAAHHYDVIRGAVQQLLGSGCGTRAVGESC